MKRRPLDRAFRDGGSSRLENGSRLLGAVLWSPPVRASAAIVAALVVVGVTVRLLRGTCLPSTAVLGWLLGAALLAFSMGTGIRTKAAGAPSAPRSASAPKAPGWSLAARRIEQQKARDVLIKIQAQRLFRQGTPQAIWRAEMDELCSYTAARISEMGGSPPPDLLDRIVEMDRSAVLSKDYPGRMAAALVALIERLCPHSR